MTIATREPVQVLAEREAPADIIALLDKAIERGIPVESLERLVALHERVMDRQAASEFAAAMAGFQAACRSIPKTSTASIVSKKSGVRYSYTYAELDEIAKTVNPLLHERGLSYSWDSEFSDRLLRVICTVRHVNGHQITASFALPVENESAMSDQQKHAAALTYARRQSLIQALGLTTTDPDTDAVEGERITEVQAHDLETLCDEAATDKAKLLTMLGVKRFADVRMSQYQIAVNMVKAKAARKAAAQ